MGLPTAGTVQYPRSAGPLARSQSLNQRPPRIIGQAGRPPFTRQATARRALPPPLLMIGAIRSTLTYPGQAAARVAGLFGCGSNSVTLAATTRAVAPSYGLCDQYLGNPARFGLRSCFDLRSVAFAYRAPSDCNDREPSNLAALHLVLGLLFVPPVQASRWGPFSS